MLLFGDKDIALLDLWSIEHFCMGVNVGLIAIFISEKYFKERDTQFKEMFQLFAVVTTEFY